MSYVLYETVQDVQAMQNYNESVAQHFGSDAMAEKYLDGLINWDGQEIDDYGRVLEYVEADPWPDPELGLRHHVRRY